MAGGGEVGASYGRNVAFIYIFNLIIGTGALALPLAFKSAGLILGLIFLSFIGFLAYITATWLIEAQAVANAMFKLKGEDETDPMLRKPTSINDDSSPFEIERRAEVGLMSEMFLGKRGKMIFYLIIIVYLFGDLAIYATVVPTSLVKVTGGWAGLTQHQVYYIYLAVFACLMVPLSMFNFQKTKPIQIITLVTRNLAFVMMVVLGIIYVAGGHGARVSNLKWFSIEGLPNLFGTSVYAFMCHHSLPSIITPIQNKGSIYRLLGIDFVCIFIAYSTLCASGLFAFGDVTNSTCSPSDGNTFVPCELQPLYTLNFQSYPVRVIADFLALFPVFTLSTNFPLICITLRNNILQFFPSSSPSRFKFIVCSLCACLIPIGVAFITDDITSLVKFTGSFAGLGILLVMPALLVHYARKEQESLFEYHGLSNQYASPFQHEAFVFLVLILSTLFLCMNTFNLIYDRVHE